MFSPAPPELPASESTHRGYRHAQIYSDYSGCISLKGNQGRMSSRHVFLGLINTFPLFFAPSHPPISVCCMQRRVDSASTRAAGVCWEKQ